MQSQIYMPVSGWLLSLRLALPEHPVPTLYEALATTFSSVQPHLPHGQRCLELCLSPKLCVHDLLTPPLTQLPCS